MAQLVCTTEEYIRFVGPSIRNRIQRMTYRRKRKLNRCEGACGRTGVELEAAHPPSQPWNTVLTRVLSRYESGGVLTIPDLAESAQAILAAHQPIDEYFKFLCHDCHLNYGRT